MSASSQSAHALVRRVAPAIEAAPEIVDSSRALVVIAINSDLAIEVTYEWLLKRLQGDARRQIEYAALVIVTDTDARLAQVLKNEAVAGEFLTMHTASIG